MYNENDEKELLYCLNTYLNEHINYAQNKNYSYVSFESIANILENILLMLLIETYYYTIVLKQ